MPESKSLKKSPKCSEMERSTRVTITKDLKTLHCGDIVESQDIYGNDRFAAINVIDHDTYTFWTKGGAKLWLEMCGMLRGKA